MKKNILFLASLLAGCGTFGMNKMTPEQIAASARDKNASVACVYAEYIGGKATTVIVNVDQRVIETGGVAINNDCTVLITNRRENARATD